MDCDDIVIGSGLSALGTVLGLAPQRRVLVIGGPMSGSSQYYEATRAVPCAHIGFGGLGNFWHGVIPMGARPSLGESSDTDFERVFHHFYPGADLDGRLGQPFVFVPWRPIRPAAAWPRVAAERGGRLLIAHQSATRFVIGTDHVLVETSAGLHRAGRVWVCSGAVQTPGLLERSLAAPVARKAISDHVLCYVGQIDRRHDPEVSPARVERTARGMWLQVWFNKDASGLFSLRPARFAFRRLDSGIERRAVFGLPMASALAKIFRGASAGLLAEALYNRVGLFPNAHIHSVYAQFEVPDAHWLRGNGEAPLEIRHDVVRKRMDKVRASAPWSAIVPSRRPELFLPVIHLHHSVNLDALHALGVNTPSSRVQVVDASIYDHIGSEHHSFRLMVAAYARARAFQ